YSVLVGNDWLKKTQANIDFASATMTLKYQGKTVQVPCSYAQNDEADDEFGNDEVDWTEANYLFTQKTHPQLATEAAATAPVGNQFHLTKETIQQISIKTDNRQHNKEFQQLMNEFKHIFADNLRELGRTDIAMHRIDVGDAPPQKQRYPYHATPREQEFIKQEVQRMLENDL